MKEINLEEILSPYMDMAYLDTNTKIPDKCHTYLIAFGKKVAEKTLELAAENAKIKEVCAEHDDYLIHVINRQSILDTINQIK